MKQLFIVISILMHALIAGCSLEHLDRNIYLKMYEGPKLPAEETTSIRFWFNKNGEQIIIDGNEYSIDQQTFVHFSLLPGKHTIDFTIPLRRITAKDVISIAMEAGHQYTFLTSREPHLFGQDQARVRIYDQTNKKIVLDIIY